MVAGIAGDGHFVARGLDGNTDDGVLIELCIAVALLQFTLRCVNKEFDALDVGGNVARVTLDSHLLQAGGVHVLEVPESDDIGCRSLAVVGNAGTVDIVSATEGQSQCRGLALILEGVDATVGIVLAIDGSDCVAIGVGDGDSLTAGVGAAADADGCIAAHLQFHSLSGAEGPAVGVVVVATVRDIDTLVVGGIEVGISQVVSVRRLVVGHLDGSSHGIERHVALHLVSRLDLLAASSLGEPATEGGTFFDSHIAGAKVELADGLLALGFLSTDGAAVSIHIGEGVGCVQCCNLFLCQSADSHVGAVGHARDGQRRGIALIIQDIHVVTVVLPAGGAVGGLLGHHITLTVGHRDGAAAVGALSDCDLHIASVGNHHAQLSTAVLTVVLATDSSHCAGIVGSHTAHRSVISDSNSKIHISSLDLFLSRQQCPILVVDDDTEVLETVSSAYHGKHEQQAQSAKSSK